MGHSPSLGRACFLTAVIPGAWLGGWTTFLIRTLLRVYDSSCFLYGRLISPERSPLLAYMVDIFLGPSIWNQGQGRGEGNEVLQFSMQTSLNLISSPKSLHTHSSQRFQTWSLSDWMPPENIPLVSAVQCGWRGKEGCLPWSTKWRKLPGPPNTDFQWVFWCQPHTLAPPSVTNASAPGPLSSSSGVSHFLLGMPLLHQPFRSPPLLLLPFFQCVGIFGPPLFPVLFSLSEFTSFGFFTSMVVSLRRERGCLWSILLDFLTLPVPWRCSSTGFGFACASFSFWFD